MLFSLHHGRNHLQYASQTVSISHTTLFISYLDCGLGDLEEIDHSRKSKRASLSHLGSTAYSHMDFNKNRVVIFIINSTSPCENRWPSLSVNRIIKSVNLICLEIFFSKITGVKVNNHQSCTRISLPIRIFYTSTLGICPNGPEAEANP